MFRPSPDTLKNREKVWDFTEKWEAHFTPLINDVTLYKEFIPLFENKFEAEKLELLVSDFILFLLMVFYFEIPFVYGHHLCNQEYTKHKLKLQNDKELFTKKLQVVLDDIDKYRPFVYTAQQHKGYRYNDEAHFHTSKMIDDYKKILSDVIQNLTEYTNTRIVYDKSINFMYTRELDSLVGIRNLCVRYIALCMQVVEIYIADRQTYKFIYNFLNRVLPKEYKSSLSNLGIDNIPKYIKNIDIHNPEQSYTYTFAGCQEYHEHENIHQRIIHLYKTQICYDKFLSFRIHHEPKLYLRPD